MYTGKNVHRNISKCIVAMVVDGQLTLIFHYFLKKSSRFFKFVNFVCLENKLIKIICFSIFLPLHTISANNNIDSIVCWHMIRTMSVVAFFRIGSVFHLAAFVNVTIFHLNIVSHREVLDHWENT